MISTGKELPNTLQKQNKNQWTIIKLDNIKRSKKSRCSKMQRAIATQ